MQDLANVASSAELPTCRERAQATVAQTLTA